MIVREFPYQDTSNRKSYEEIGRSINLIERNGISLDGEDEMRLEVMERQSTTYFELAQLVDAIDAMSQWRAEEEKYISKVPTPPTVPADLKSAFLRVKETMEPIVQKGLLRRPVDKGEERDLEFIRVHYLPEIVLAYNTVLHSAGNLITRDSLLDSMELSVAIANGKKHEHDNGLQEVFVKAGRMRELVESFALTSKTMLILKAEGQEWRPKKGRRGMDLGIWEIGGA